MDIVNSRLDSRLADRQQLARSRAIVAGRECVITGAHRGMKKRGGGREEAASAAGDSDAVEARAMHLLQETHDRAGG